MLWQRTLVGFFALYASVVAADVPSQLEDQRAIFRSAWESAERGEWTPSAAETRMLRAYVLWPDLRGRYLERNLASSSAGDITAFLNRYPSGTAARSLRYRYSQFLFKRKAWARYLEIYESHYEALGQTALDCQAITAQIRTNTTVNGARALQLWRSGRSQPDDCDPVFDWLREGNMLGADEYQRRFDLAIEAGEYNLAKWLAKSLSAGAQASARRWQTLRDAPAKALARENGPLASAETLARVRYGFERLARKDTELAWQTYEEKFAKRLTGQLATDAAIRESIALVSSWRHEPTAGTYYQAVAKERRGQELQEWGVRAALRKGDWTGVVSAIDALDESLAKQSNWRYWQAIALSQTGQKAAGEGLLAELASERSYYGFLAADALGLDYAFDHANVEPDADILATLAAEPALVRARELFKVGLLGRGRSEWDRTVRAMDAPRKRQAALLAAEWGWYSRAIAAAAGSGSYDDLDLRYPLPWQQAFDRFASNNEIPVEWAYGIARSESLFMQDIRSSAGAIGLMQLMPATGKATARKEKVRYSGLKTLTNAETNIRLGTRYLADMATRFKGQQVLATAAYNAGPHRVDRWIEGVEALPAAIWIETIPFDETRAYVQRVMAASAVFYWRLNEKQQRLAAMLVPVSGPPRSARR